MNEENNKPQQTSLPPHIGIDWFRFSFDLIFVLGLEAVLCWTFGFRFTPKFYLQLYLLVILIRRLFFG